MTKKEIIELLKEAYETGRIYGVADTEEFPDDEKLDANSFESFIEGIECRLPNDVPNTETICASNCNPHLDPGVLLLDAITELEKCKNPEYFIKNYVKINTTDEDTEKQQ